MAYRVFGRLRLSKGLLAGGVTLGGAAVSFSGSELCSRLLRPNDPDYTAAEEHFYTSSLHPVPTGWKGRKWVIRNDYPLSEGQYDDGMPVLPGPISPPSGDSISDAPWLNPESDFRRSPAAYCALIKEYCLEGNVHMGPEKDDFVVQNNMVCCPPLYSVFP